VFCSVFSFFYILHVMVTYIDIGYGDSNGGQVEDGESVHTTYFMVKDLKTVAGVYIKLDI